MLSIEAWEHALELFDERCNVVTCSATISALEKAPRVSLDVVTPGCSMAFGAALVGLDAEDATLFLRKRRSDGLRIGAPGHHLQREHQRLSEG